MNEFADELARRGFETTRLAVMLPIIAVLV